MRECRCRLPVAYPTRPDACVKCGCWINPEWVSGDRTVSEFFDRLASTFPQVPDTFRVFRLQCEARELAGRPRFGHAFLARENLAEAREEAADLALYAMLDVLKARRRGEHDDIDLALAAAWHAFKSYEALLTLREKRRGAP